MLQYGEVAPCYLLVLVVGDENLDLANLFYFDVCILFSVFSDLFGKNYGLYACIPRRVVTYRFLSLPRSVDVVMNLLWRVCV